MTHTSYRYLDQVQKELLDAASGRLDKAYNPYSHFYVSAAALSQDGRIKVGVNFENASSSLTICAERTAIVSAYNDDMFPLEMMAIITKGEDFDSVEPTPPCGACRQVIYEVSQVSDHDIEIIRSSTDKQNIAISTISEMLVDAFGPKDLGIDLTKYR